MRRSCHQRVLRSCSLLLAALQFAVLLVTFEPRAQAYVGPGSGSSFVFLQVAGSVFAGTIYYFRRRLRRILGSMRRPARIVAPAGTYEEAAENCP
jgi:hypothetical protein